MVEGLFNQPNYLAAKKMLDAAVLRHEGIAANLANLETPNYKRVDVGSSFMTELQQAMTSKDAGHIASVQPGLNVDPTITTTKPDGNNVQLEHELAELNKNFLAHTLETQLITENLLRLRLAITGRPG